MKLTKKGAVTIVTCLVGMLIAFGMICHTAITNAKLYETEKQISSKLNDTYKAVSKRNNELFEENNKLQQEMELLEQEIDN